MKKFAIFAFILAFVALSAGAKKKNEPVNPDSTGFKFTDVIKINCTPVGDQYKTGTCWCFSSNSFLENEILKKTGKTVNLSEMFVVHHCYLDKAMKYARMDGAINFAQGGSALDVPYAFRTYGAMPEEVYGGLNYGEDMHNHYELIAVLKNYMDGINKIPNKRMSTSWYKGLGAILDAYLGEIPSKFTYQGKEYTPMSFSKSLGIDINDYVSVTSFTHHPFYSKFIMEVADNWLWGESINVPINDFKAVVDNELANGHTVAWSADISEGGWQWKNGFAIMAKEKKAEEMDSTEYARWSKISTKEREEDKYNFNGPVPEINVTQEVRQQMFDRHETTDDHGMVIVGTAVDQKGNKYYKVKNSWGTNQLYNGYIYVSEAYFLAKTISVLVNKNFIPADIAKKLPK